MRSYFKGTTFDFTLQQNAAVFSLSWTHNIGYYTGTSTFQINIDSVNVVYSTNTNSGTINGITPSNEISFILYGTSENYNTGTVNIFGGASYNAVDCNLYSSLAVGSGIYLSGNAYIDASSTDNIFGCV